MTEQSEKFETLKDYVKHFEGKMRCNCDLDNWEPEPNTGHSHVCRIHKAARKAHYERGYSGKVAVL